MKRAIIGNMSGLVRSSLSDMKEGAFTRKASVHRNFIGDSRFPAETGRYILAVSYACPWAHRCIIVRALLGLEAVVPMYVTHPTWELTKPKVDEHRGWVFAPSGQSSILHPSGANQIPIDEWCTPPPVKFASWTSVRSIYDTSGDVNSTKFTVPVLFDTKSKTIVNNESSEIIRMLYDPSLLGQFATKNRSLNLRPRELEVKIDSVNEWIYHQINNGVYKAGFASAQQAYEKAAHELEDGLTRVEAILSQSRFLVSDQVITEADIRFFPTLIRHDEVYTVYFKCSHVPVVTPGTRFPNIVRYMKDMWSFPEVRQSTVMAHIKNHYYTSHSSLNPYGVVPLGPRVISQLEAVE